MITSDCFPFVRIDLANPNNASRAQVACGKVISWPARPADACALPAHRPAQDRYQLPAAAFLENRSLLPRRASASARTRTRSAARIIPILAALESDGPEAVFDQIAEAPGDRLLISAEELCPGKCRPPDSAAAIRGAALRHFDPHVVIFLRRQDFLKESVYAEIVKGWFAGDILERHSLRLRPRRARSALEETFGADRVHVVLYHDPGPNDIVGELLAATRTHLDRARLRPVEPRNVSMHRRKVLFLGQVPKPGLWTTRGRAGCRTSSPGWWRARTRSRTTACDS